MPVLAIAGIDLVAFIIALAAILVLFALWVFAKPIELALSHAPLIGSAIGNTVTHWLEDAMKAVANAFDGLVSGVAQFFFAFATGVWHLMGQVMLTLADAKQWAIEAYKGLLSLSANVTALEAQLQHDLGQVLTEAEQGALLDAEGLVRPLETAVTALEADVTALGQDVAQGVEEAIAAATAAAGALIAPAIAGLETDITNAFDLVQSEAVTLFGQAEAGIATLGQDIIALPGVIEGTIPGVVEGLVPGIIAGAIPGILAQVLPRVTTLEGEMTRCVEPLCDTVTPQAPRLGNILRLLQGLEDLAIEALLVALAAECLTNPQAVVDDISTVVNDVGEPILTGFRDLIGV